MKNRKKIVVIFIIGVIVVIAGFLGIMMSMMPRTTDPVSPEATYDSAIDRSDQLNAALPIPPLLTDENPDPKVADFSLIAQNGNSIFIEGKSTPTMGYNGDFLGPVLKVTKGDTVNVNVTNALDDSTSVHWHGLIVGGQEDGGPHQVVLANETWSPSFVIDQPAATLWFHPHVIGTTATQVYSGLAGLIIIEDENSKNLNLPDDYGVNDIPLVIQDRSFNNDGSFVYETNMMNGVIGDQILVNGAITPILEVEQIKMRFRILNGANARNLGLVLDDRSAFYQIASDGGLLEEPIGMKGLFLAPAERAEIIIDFSRYDEGDVIQLDTGEEVVMTFKVGGKSQDVTIIPDTLATIEKLDPSTAVAVKKIELDGMGRMVSINGKRFDMNRIDDFVNMGETEIWEITSNSSMMMRMGHPFHVHSTQFQVLTRNGEAPYENEKGWKDTVFVEPDETVRIIVNFKKEGVFMYHCHILEHEEAGMMGQFEVK